MSLTLSAPMRFNLDRAAALLVDESPIGISILAQIVTGMGVKTLLRCENDAQARAAALTCHFDFAIVDALGPTGAGYRFVEWLRREAPQPYCYHPVLLTASHTPARSVEIFANSGGDALIKKPIIPMTLLERILWAARPDRQFVVADDYVGPARRNRSVAAEGRMAAGRELRVS